MTKLNSRPRYAPTHTQRTIKFKNAITKLSFPKDLTKATKAQKEIILYLVAHSK